MLKNISNFNTTQKLIENLGEEIVQLSVKADDRLSILISGGKTPELLFKYLRERCIQRVNWKLIDVFWVDERCVSNDSLDSNFGQANRLLFQYCDGVNLYPIYQGGNFHSAAKAYGEFVLDYVKSNGPFDFSLLGIGEDGHFASLFRMEDILNSDLVFVNSIGHHLHKRITMSIPLILNSKKTVVIAMGSKKGKAFSEGLGILNMLPLGCHFYVDDNFMNSYKSVGESLLNEI
jgi:6-phosphogluconolactonase